MYDMQSHTITHVPNLIYAVIKFTKNLTPLPGGQAWWMCRGCVALKSSLSKPRANYQHPLRSCLAWNSLPHTGAVGQDESRHGIQSLKESIVPLDMCQFKHGRLISMRTLVASRPRVASYVCIQMFPLETRFPVRYVSTWHIHHIHPCKDTHI